MSRFIASPVTVGPSVSAMPLTTSDRRMDNLHHAQWRVNFQQSLLDMHRSTTWHGPGWYDKEAECARRLMEAREELHRLEIGLLTQPPEGDG
jgi:hypothetical protein